MPMRLAGIGVPVCGGLELYRGRARPVGVRRWQELRAGTERDGGGNEHGDSGSELSHQLETHLLILLWMLYVGIPLPTDRSAGATLGPAAPPRIEALRRGTLCGMLRLPRDLRHPVAAQVCLPLDAQTLLSRRRPWKHRLSHDGCKVILGLGSLGLGSRGQSGLGGERR